MIPWYGLLIIFPLFCALVGYLTNVIAVRMIFRPVEPIRLLGLRFQGVLPKHHHAFAADLALVVTQDFMTTGEMVARLDAEALFGRLEPRWHALMDRVLDEVRASLPPALRSMLGAKEAVLVKARVHEALVAALPTLQAQVKARADRDVDLCQMIASRLDELGPRRFTDIVMQMGARELRYIEVYGGLLGFLIGLVQFSAIHLVPTRLLLVLVGVFVGGVTNYLAIQMLFYPRRPVSLGVLNIQGLFPKRQEEIATELAGIAARQFIVPDRIFRTLARALVPTGPALSEAMTHLEARLLERHPALHGLIQGALDDQGRQALRARLLALAEAELPALVDETVALAGEQLDIPRILKAKVVALSTLRYERFIRKLFMEEERYLVIYGALLGGLMGTIQLALMVLRRWL